ncbi:MAG: HAMP domain-containing sensor histidine kinase [Cyanobacteria bacterium J06639_14]
MWFKRLTGETRTRILLLYAMTMLVVMAGAIPIFRIFLFMEVDNRVREDLREELETFQEAYETWEATSPSTIESLKAFLEGFLEEDLTEDDNFHIFILDDKLYRSNPRALPAVIQPDSDLMQEWKTLREPVRDILPVPDPDVGSVLYKTHILKVNGIFRGQFVAVHLSAGERKETLEGVYAFVRVAMVVVLCSLLLAWLGSHQLLKPVKHLAVTAKNINESDLSHRLEVDGSGELALLAETFNAMMDRVQNAFDSQRNFLNDASHELRTPITIIQGHLELMDDDPKEQQETLELVMDELDRMGRFVNDLVLLAKSERPDFLQLETIDLEPFTEELFSKITALGDRNWQLSQVGRGKFVADRQRLTGALINIAQNAAQHTKPNDTIELGTTIAKGQVRMWIRDTGEGIAQTDQQRIFERFARTANSYRRSEGAGLGLAIVSAITEAHGGHIELTSKLGVGSTFSLILPLEKP